MPPSSDFILKRFLDNDGGIVPGVAAGLRPRPRLRLRLRLRRAGARAKRGELGTQGAGWRKCM